MTKIQIVAGQMLEELETQRLIVMKWRTENGWVRGPISTNPDWYQVLCASYTRTRRRYPKSRTIIKRGQTLRTLRRIASGLLVKGLYAERVTEIILQEIERRLLPDD